MFPSKMVTVLWFDIGEGRKAAEFYTSIFPDSRMGHGVDSATDTPSGPAGQEILVEFTVCGQPFAALDGGPNFKPNESVSFMVMTDDQAETDRLWNAIVDGGGQESECGWCKDKWGYSWQITPRVLIDAISSPDRAAAKRAMEAMMTMRKINVAAIEAAAHGVPA
jgi:predicted 3-demethylubiquinone-9 3-methyltransferase (glyoxalase superfamily)